jgi:superfamily II DNA/RNA helicase
MTFRRIAKLTVALTIVAIPTAAFLPSSSSSRHASTTTARWATSSPEEALKKTASQLLKLDKLQQQTSGNGENPEFDKIYNQYIKQPANALKMELQQRNLPYKKGRKPDLAQRLAENDLKLSKMARGIINDGDDDIEAWNPTSSSSEDDETTSTPLKLLKSFCGLQLSQAASNALTKANFQTPSPIQKAAIPLSVQGESLILHAETGSGKTLAYLLPITEQLWMEHNERMTADDDGFGYGLILLPTRELAAQVAGVATVLAPPGTVRMVSYATNLMSDGMKDRGEQEYGGRLDTGDGRTKARLFIGSAKAVMHSLYGDGKMPASPTTKPEAQHFLRSTRWVVLDEVDRLLNVKKSRSASKGRHEKPAAVVTSAIARLTFGKAQVVAASATVGRSLRRELSRVMGLSPQESPQVIRANPNLRDEEEEEEEQQVQEPGTHIARAVTIPDTVQHYVTAVDTSSSGKLLTSAFLVLKELHIGGNSKRILLVLTKGCGINTKNAIGALQHFQCKPEPKSLLDVLEADGTDRMIELHRQVSGATGVGESSYFSSSSEKEKNQEEEEEQEQGEGYLLVTGEDTVRGLHLDGLDMVVVVGKAAGPDEYTHIAGRTGRAGRTGKVISVLSHQDAASVEGWEKMLCVDFARLEIDDVENLK